MYGEKTQYFDFSLNYECDTKLVKLLNFQIGYNIYNEMSMLLKFVNHCQEISTCFGSLSH